MKQLVQLQQKADEFRAQHAEVIVVFREEKSGVRGLKKIQARTNTTLTLALDLNKQKTARYSPQQGTFTNYVLDRTGKVAAVLDGSKSRRATSEQLLQELRRLNDQ